MFGMTEQEQETYRNLVYDFAQEDLLHQIVSDSMFMVPAHADGDDIKYDAGSLMQLQAELRQVIVTTVIDMAAEYAYLQNEAEMEESEIVRHLFSKYEDVATTRLLYHGMAFSEVTSSEIAGGAVLEMPYLYSMSIEDEGFDEDTFLEERLEAYNDYLTSMYEEEEDDE